MNKSTSVHQRLQVALRRREAADVLRRADVARAGRDARFQVVNQGAHLLAHVDERGRQQPNLVAAPGIRDGDFKIAVRQRLGCVPQPVERRRGQLAQDQRSRTRAPARPPLHEGGTWKNSSALAATALAGAC